MAEITVQADSKNSPKKQLLKQLNIAFVEGDVAAITACVSDDITWTIVGDSEVQGKDAFVEMLEQMGGSQMSALTIQTIITHGREGAVSGEFTLVDGKKYAFCDVYTFSSAKGDRVKSITAYIIEI